MQLRVFNAVDTALRSLPRRNTFVGNWACHAPTRSLWRFLPVSPYDCLHTGAGFPPATCWKRCEKGVTAWCSSTLYDVAPNAISIALLRGVPLDAALGYRGETSSAWLGNWFSRLLASLFLLLPWLNGILRRGRECSVATPAQLFSVELAGSRIKTPSA